MSGDKREEEEGAGHAGGPLRKGCLSRDLKEIRGKPFGQRGQQVQRPWGTWEGPGGGCRGWSRKRR